MMDGLHSYIPTFSDPLKLRKKDVTLQKKLVQYDVMFGGFSYSIPYSVIPKILFSSWKFIYLSILILILYIRQTKVML